MPQRQQVEQQQHGAERRLGRVKLAAAKVVRTEIAFELVDALLQRGALVVVAPDHLGGLGAVGHEDPIRVAGARSG